VEAFSHDMGRHEVSIRNYCLDKLIEGSLLYISASSYMMYTFGKDIMNGLSEDSTVKTD
jgi:hypothetical protein